MTLPLSTPPVRRPAITPTNSLILLLPDALFAPQLLPLFEAHFGSYGTLVSWTALERLGRVFCVYEEVEAATEARREMDSFVWEDEAEQEQKREENGGVVVVDGGVAVESREQAEQFRTPLRVFFGPQLSLPLESLHSTLLSVPALSKNFLISPPGSPPVGWEQTLEEAPNADPHPDDLVSEAGDLAQERQQEGWADELARALRFLSVTGGAEDDDGDAPGPAAGADEGMQDAEVDGEGVEQARTSVVVAPRDRRPAVTVSTPNQASASAHNSIPATPLPPQGAQKITAVKATIESLLGRKRSLSDLRSRSRESSADGLRTPGGTLAAGGALGGGLSLGGGARITPTARPPVASEWDFAH